MKESKVLSIRIKTEIYEDFDSLCTRNKKSKKDILLECINLLLKADRIEINTKIMFPNSTSTYTAESRYLPPLNVPEKYQPLDNVSMDRRDEKYIKFIKD